MKTFFTNFKIAVFTLTLVLSVFIVAAQKTAAVSGLWNIAGTWSPSGVPGSGDDVIIGSSFTVTAAANGTCKSLTVNNTGILNLAGGNITIASKGSVNVNSGGSIIFNSSNVIDGGNSSVNGIGVFINSGASLTTAHPNGFTANGLGGSFNVDIGSKPAPAYSTTANYTFNATAAQSTGTGITGANNLTFDGGGAKTLSIATAVNGALTLTNGILTTTSSNLLTMNAGSSVSGENFGTRVSGGSNASYINGPMRKIGNTNFLFPIGSTVGSAGHHFAGIVISGASQTFTATYTRGSAKLLGPINVALVGLLDHVSHCEYWDIARTSGSTAVGVVLSWNSNSVCNSALYVNDIATLVSAHFNGASWNLFGGTTDGGSSNGSGSLTWSGVNTFSKFSLGSTESGTNPLPVKFNDVKAFEKQNGVQVEWTNLTEKELVNYLVERSVNGVDFSAIATIAPRGNQSDKESYTSFDATPIAGANFYRIKAIEFGGKIIYSQLMKVTIGEKTTGIKLFPNPVSGNQVTIGFATAKGQYNLQVVNAIGQVVLTQSINHQGGTMSQSISLPETLKPGIYNLFIMGNNYKETKTFIVQ